MNFPEEKWPKTKLFLSKLQCIREQWYYNNGLQEIVTSIHLVKITAKLLQNSLDSNPDQQVLLKSLVLRSDN